MHDGTGNSMHETLLDQITFKQADHYSLPIVKQFYKLNGMRAQAPKGDLIFTASINSKLVAALRLHPVNQCYLLRSMCVAADLRHQGIGSGLLMFLQNQFNDIECYSFPFSHLQQFYESAGFQLCDSIHAPEAIADKFNRYLCNGKDICLMKHHQKSVLK